MKLAILALMIFPSVLLGQTKKYSRPAILDLEELNEFAGLSDDRQKLLRTAMETAQQTRSKKYKFGGASPSAGGFDCSGAMFYVMRESELKPPRTSAQQYSWIRKAEKLIPVGSKIRKVDDPVFKKLLPGDLLFWSGTYVPVDGRNVKISHVGMYLGTEKKDGRPVMITATTGRSYRGTAADGFGVYDFKLPSSKSKSRFVGYGSPPGLN